jgi:hypothetical protein
MEWRSRVYPDVSNDRAANCRGSIHETPHRMQRADDDRSPDFGQADGDCDSLAGRLGWRGEARSALTAFLQPGKPQKFEERRRVVAGV